MNQNPTKSQVKNRVEMYETVLNKEQEIVELDANEAARLPAMYQDAYYKANRLRRSKRVDMSKFGYSDYEDDMSMLAAKIRAIKVNVAELKKSDKGVKQLAEGVILEVMIQDLINGLKLLSNNTRSRPASLFDDVINGVDILLEHRNDDYTAHASVSVDVTYGATSFEHKLALIKREVEFGRLGEVKYYESVDGNTKSRLNAVPKLVVGIPESCLVCILKTG